MDTMNIFKIVFLLALVAEMAIRIPYRHETKQNAISDNRVSRQEKLLLGLLFLGMFLLPMLYSFTPWLDFANYTLPTWAGWLDVVPILAAL